MNTVFQQIKISHVSAVLPSNIIDLQGLAGIYGDAEVKKIIKTTGIQSVRYADAQTTSADLCEKAAKEILAKKPELKTQINGLIFVSQTRDYILPQTSHLLQHKLDLKQDTVCFDLPIGCTGYIYGILQAAMLINSGMCNKVLVLAGDTTSKIVSKGDRTVSMVFGDAGTATLVEKGTGTIGVILKSDGAGAKDLIIPAGGFRKPKNIETSLMKSYEDNLQRSDEHLFMDGMQVFNFSISQIPKIIEDALLQMYWKKEETDQFVLHQANEFMVNYLAKRLKLKSEQVPLSVKEYGNTGPSSIPLTLCDQFYEKKTNLEKVILCGFGVGLSWGTIGINLNDTIFDKPINY